MKYSKAWRNQQTLSLDLDTSYKSMESYSSLISDVSFVGQEDIAFTNNKTGKTSSSSRERRDERKSQLL